MIGACSFASYAVWRVSPLAAGALAFATGIGAYGWVGFFFVINPLGFLRRAVGSLRRPLGPGRGRHVDDRPGDRARAPLSGYAADLPSIGTFRSAAAVVGSA
jgi:hypothetical protein